MQPIIMLACIVSFSQASGSHIKQKTLTILDASSQNRLWTPLGSDFLGFWEPKWTQNWSKIDSKSEFLNIFSAWEPVLKAWITFWAQDSDFSDFWDLTAAKNYLHFGPKMFKNHLKIDPKLNKFFDHFFDRLWSPLGTDLVGFWEPTWTQNWSRIGPKSDHEADANIFRIIGRGRVFEDPRCLDSIKNRS